MNTHFAIPHLLRIVLIAGLAACAQGGEAQQGRTNESVARAPTKWALLIGIDRYKSPTISRLRGTVNDVERVKRLLVTRFEFPEQNILVLRNEQATHAAIVNAIQKHLIANAQKGDIVVIHYSGHGSQMPDNTNDETDGEDETLVAYDSRLPNIFDISDDEINGLLAQLGEKTDNVTLILDSCHSGTGTRGAGFVRSVEPDRRDPPPPPSYARSAGETDAAAFRQLGSNFVLLAAARSEQSSYEYDQGAGAYGGAFTFFLTEELGRAGGGATYRDIMDKVTDQMAARYGNQDPQIEGAGEHTYVFSDSTSVADPYYLAGPIAGGRARIAGGSAHGVTLGSVFEVYPPGTKHFVPPAAATAKIAITAVGPFTSEANILTGRVESNARAVEREHAFPDQKLRIYYRGRATSPTLRAVRLKLSALNNIQEQAAPAGYDLLLREEAGHILFEAADTLELTPRVPAQPNSVGKIVDLVQEWARWFNLLSIKNPLSAVAIEVSLPRREFVDGDSLDITVTNKSDRALFITIMDLSSDGSVGQAFPDPAVGGAQLLPAGQTRAIPLEVFVPEGRTSVRDVLKVFAATTDIDLRPLTQPPIVARNPAARGPRDPLHDLIAQAAVGTTRNSRTRVKLGDWVVEQRSLVVKQRPGT
jgi:hypothetical protein